MSGDGEIRPIETPYKGHRFRSRLEARWAVWLDAMDVEWVYEPEGYELPDGNRYLCDFWLPQPGCWLEIKGREPTAEARRKAIQLSRGTRHDVFIVSGQPYWGAYTAEYVLPFDFEEYADRPSYRGVIFGQCRRCDGLCWVADAVLSDDEPIAWGDIGAHTCRDHDRWPLTEPEFAHHLDQAFRAARGARFEHGEHGAAPARNRPRREPIIVDRCERCGDGHGLAGFMSDEGGGTHGLCAACFASWPLPAPDAASEAFSVASGSRITHRGFGRGTIVRSQPVGLRDTIIIVRFENGETRRMPLSLVYDRLTSGWE